MSTDNGLAATGVILCGGQSTRMGSDKGLLKEGDQTWAQIAAKKLAALQLPVFVSINPQQQPDYNKIFPEQQLITDHQNLFVKGPLLGLLSVHAKLPEADLFVLACDMKGMTMALLQNLLAVFREETSEAIVYRTGEKVQPLCGIYSAEALKRIYNIVQEGNLKKFSMMHVLEQMNAGFIAASGDDLIHFNNYNSPKEM